MPPFILKTRGQTVCALPPGRNSLAAHIGWHRRPGAFHAISADRIWSERPHLIRPFSSDRTPSSAHRFLLSSASLLVGFSSRGFCSSSTHVCTRRFCYVMLASQSSDDAYEGRLFDAVRSLAVCVQKAPCVDQWRSASISGRGAWL